MLNEKMKAFQDYYNTFSDNDILMYQYVDENIHAEKFINQELVTKCITTQKKNKKIKFDSMTDEDQIIACITVARYLELDYFYDWCKEFGTVNLKLFDKYLVPRYAALIDPFCEDKVDFEKEFAEYKPEIKIGEHHNVWAIKLNYGENMNSVFELENLDKEGLKFLKEKVAIISEFAKRVKEYIEERDLFISKIYNLLDKDHYERRKSSIYLDTAKGNRTQKHLMVDSNIYSTCSVYHDFSISGMSTKIKVIRGTTVVGVICDKEVHFDNIEDIMNNPQFIDLDEIFIAVKYTIEQNYQSIAILD